jgi:DNA-directed RNA polymerase specialized sigma24 family protein
LSSAEETQRSLERFLAGVVRHKAIDRLRRQKHVGGSLDDPLCTPNEVPQIDSSVVEAEFARLRERLYAILQNEQDLIDLIAATEFISGEHTVNQELADILGKSEQDVVNLKRKLQSRPAVKDLLYGKRQKTERKKE